MSRIRWDTRLRESRLSQILATPQGKNERFHSTLFKWLKKQPFAKDLVELQAQIEVFDQANNTQRGHQAFEDRMTPQEAWDATPVAEPLALGEWMKHSTTPPPGVGEAVLAVWPSEEQSPTPQDGSTPEPTKLSATLRTERMEATGSQLMRVNKNRCLRVAGVELYLGKLLRSAMVKVIWDQAELIVISMEGELITKYDYPFPDGVTLCPSAAGHWGAGVSAGWDGLVFGLLVQCPHWLFDSLVEVTVSGEHPCGLVHE